MPLEYYLLFQDLHPNKLCIILSVDIHKSSWYRTRCNRTTTLFRGISSPFMPLHPTVYAELLSKIKKHKAKVWMVNTGWTGGEFGTGERIELRYTRKMLSEAIAGKLDKVEYVKIPFSDFRYPYK